MALNLDFIRCAASDTACQMNVSHNFAKELLTARELGEESRELGDGELFGAGIGAEILRGESAANLFRLDERAQVVDQRFALLRET